MKFPKKAKVPVALAGSGTGDKLKGSQPHYSKDSSSCLPLSGGQNSSETTASSRVLDNVCISSQNTQAAYGVKRGHYVAVYASGVESRHSIQGSTPQRALAEQVVCPGFPEGGCAACGLCGRAAARRGTVGEFSKASRRRLRRLLMAIPWQFLVEGRRVAWLTLTFPDNVTVEASNKARRAFLTALKRKYGAAVVWKREFQDRGAAHFHLLVIFPGRYPVGLLSWVRVVWARLGGGFVKVTCAHSWKGLVKYMIDQSKEGCQTIPPEWAAAPGRWWGAWSLPSLASVVKVWGVKAWSRGRRLVTRLICGSKASRRRLHAGFVDGGRRWLEYLKPLETGAAVVCGLDSVMLSNGRGRIWAVENWSAAA